MRATLMTARTLLLPLSALALGLLLVAACGGDGDGEPLPGNLTDPSSVPTATPWTNPPEPIILGPDILTPIIQEDGGIDEDGDTDEDGATDEDGDQVTPGDCGDTYTVQSGDVPYSIAQECGVDVTDLLELNDIDDPKTLHVGQELKIPQ
jgi:hypothetical protein